MDGLTDRRTPDLNYEKKNLNYEKKNFFEH